MGIRSPMNVGGFDSQKIIEDLMKVEAIPVESAKKRRELLGTEKQEVEKLQTFLNDLDSSLNSLKTKTDFYKLQVESSHPDIIDGVVANSAMLGTYEFEVRGLARTEKELAYGFPDKDQTPVGFGFMTVKRDDREDLEVVVKPNSTLQDVANQINDSEAGVRAMIINTKYKPDSYRLLVISEDSGEEAKIVLDEDTTFLEFKEQVSGRNLDVLFEDVPVTDSDNILEELVDGVTFNVKRSEPGTRVQVNVTHNLEATVESIAGFVEKYNQLAKFIHEQFVVNGETKRAGILAADSSIKTIMRQLQSSVVGPASSRGKFSTLAEVGITTNPKTGELNLDKAKVESALAEDYEGVANLFVRTNAGDGVAQRLADKLKAFRDPVDGVIKTRMRGLERILKNQDQDIERKERMLEQKEETLRQRFTALQGQLAASQSQGQFLAQRFGSPQGGPQAPGGGG